MGRLNPHVRVDKIARRLDDENARALVAGYDVVVDGSDNFATRYAVSDACFFERRPLVSAAIGEFDGSLTTLKPYAAQRRRRRAEPDLSLPVSRGAAAGNRPDLRRSRRAGGSGRRARLADGAGSRSVKSSAASAMATRPRRQTAAGRHARDALRDADLRLGRGKPAQRTTRWQGYDRERRRKNRLSIKRQSSITVITEEGRASARRTCRRAASA